VTALHGRVPDIALPAKNYEKTKKGNLSLEIVLSGVHFAGSASRPVKVLKKKMRDCKENMSVAETGFYRKSDPCGRAGLSVA
jgi:hypothetical protein